MGIQPRWLGPAQVNLGLVLSLNQSLTSLLQVCFLEASSDVVTLKNLVAEIKAFGIAKSLFILDRGFYSESNIKEMTAENIDFILPLPFSVNIGKSLISETNQGSRKSGQCKEVLWRHILRFGKRGHDW